MHAIVALAMGLLGSAAYLLSQVFFRRIAGWSLRSRSAAYAALLLVAAAMAIAVGSTSRASVLGFLIGAIGTSFIASEKFKAARS